MEEIENGDKNNFANRAKCFRVCKRKSNWHLCVTISLQRQVGMSSAMHLNKGVSSLAMIHLEELVF